MNQPRLTILFALFTTCGTLSGDETPRILIDREELVGQAIFLERAESQKLHHSIEAYGQVVLPPHRLLNLKTPLDGFVQAIHVEAGSLVDGHTPLLTLESHALQEAAHRAKLQRERGDLFSQWRKEEEELAKRGFSSPREVTQKTLEEKEALAESNLSLASLHRFGPIQAMENSHILSLEAPFAGTILEVRVAPFEKVAEGETLLLLADLQKIVVDLSLPIDDRSFVEGAEEILLADLAGNSLSQADYRFRRPYLDGSTQRYLASLTPREPSLFLPGQFVKATFRQSFATNHPTILKSALQMVEEEPTIFIYRDNGFIPRSVTIGKEDEERVEIVEGIELNEEYASQGSFVLKSALLLAEEE